MDVWERFREFFEEDDGSLPGVNIRGMPPEVVDRTYRFLRSIGGTLDDCIPPPTLHFVGRDESTPVDSVPNAAELVARGEVEPIHFVFSVTFDGIRTPPLGLWVVEDGIGLDIRMGPEWTPPSAIAYLELLRKIWNDTPNPRLEFEEFARKEAFESLWSEFLKTEPFSGLKYIQS